MQNSLLLCVYFSPKKNSQSPRQSVSSRWTKSGNKLWAIIIVVLSAGFFHTESRKFTWTQVKVSNSVKNLQMFQLSQSDWITRFFCLLTFSLSVLCVWSCSGFLCKRKKHMNESPGNCSNYDGCLLKGEKVITWLGRTLMWAVGTGLRGIMRFRLSPCSH